MEGNLQLLPPRRKPQGKIEPAGKSYKLMTNLYEISLKRSPNLEQYTVEVQPSIDDHAISLLRKILLVKKEELKKEIGLLTFKGKVLWGIVKQPKAIIMNVAKNVEQNIQHDYQILIKHTRSIAYEDICALKSNQVRQIQQIYTVMLRQKLYKMGLKQSTRNRFIQKGQGELVKGYTILKCYEVKLVPIMKTLSLLVDVGFRLLNQRNALQELYEIKNNSSKEEYAKGKIVVTMYNNRSYRIDRICFDKNPKSTFLHQNRGKMMTFVDYFQQFHKITPKKMDQPLFETTIFTKKQLKGETIVKKDVKGYLIPEFCKFAATLINIKDQDYHSFNDISKIIKIFPQERKSKQVYLIKQLNKCENGFSVSEYCKQVEGFVYQDITVLGKFAKPCNNGMQNIRQIKEPRQFLANQLLMVYSTQKKDNRYIQDIFGDLVYSGKHFNIQFKGVQYLQVDSYGVQAWIQQIHQFMSTNPKVGKNLRLIILLFANNQKGFYGELKKYITNQLALPCQVILRRTAEHKSKTTILGKIALQINAKSGNTLWSVQTRHHFWRKKKVAYGAFSVSKNLKQESRKKGKNQSQMLAENKKEYVIGFVGTCSQDFSKIYANTALVEKEEELQSFKPFEDIIADWLKNYKSRQDGLPQIIIIYREGLTQKQVNTRCRAQIEGIQKVISRARVKYTNYDPQIIYLLVTKRSPKRVYKPQRTPNSGKFAPAVMANPIPGTILFQSISSQDVYDFHLTAQYTTQGTSTLTNYRVAYDASQIPQEAIAQFTLEQCYNYPNWQGGISVPGCLQSADRLSRLVGEHIHQNITDKTIEYEKSVQCIRNKPFYL